MPDPGTSPPRLRDGGPSYVETPPDLEQFTGWVAEPWNTATAILFVVIPLIWFWVLRGRYRQHPFLMWCLPILLVGGIGGVLYHGTRTSRVFFLLDVIPIYTLGAVTAVYFWVRLGPKLSHLFGMLAFLCGLQLLAHLRLPIHWAINISYANLAIIILIPLIYVMIRTRFHQAGWVYTGMAVFAIAWIARFVDKERPPLLPMGTHWLWHTFGAAATTAVSIYIYHVEGLSLRKQATATSKTDTLNNG